MSERSLIGRMSDDSGCDRPQTQSKLRAMFEDVVLEFVPPVDADPRYRGARVLRHRVLRAPLGHPLGSEFFDFEPQALHLVARVGEVVVGCVMFHPDGTGGGRLCQMAVETERQGTGLGRRLVRHLEDRLRSDGIERVILHARVPAAGFYARLGYGIVGEPYEEVGISHQSMERVL
jgi:GNAT superfamily N-acetyltransferase